MSTTSAVVLRTMTADDVAPMASLEALVSPRPWSAELFAGEMAVPSAERYWVVAVDPLTNTLVGFAGIMFVMSGGEVVEGHVMNMAVDPARQRVGLGRRLLDALLDEAHRRGAQSLTLEVRVGNTAALALYRRAGFAPVGVRPGYYGPGADALVMWLHDLQSRDKSEENAGE